MNLALRTAGSVPTMSRPLPSRFTRATIRSDTDLMSAAQPSPTEKREGGR